MRARIFLLLVMLLHSKLCFPNKMNLQQERKCTHWHFPAIFLEACRLVSSQAFFLHKFYHWGITWYFMATFSSEMFPFMASSGNPILKTNLHSLHGIFLRPFCFIHYFSLLTKLNFQCGWFLVQNIVALDHQRLQEARNRAVEINAIYFWVHKNWEWRIGLDQY